MRFSLSAIAVGLGLGVSAAGAADAGSIVIRLQTDPSPAGVAWSYSGIGQAFQLGASGSTKTISGLADGTYRLVEAGAAGQPMRVKLPEAGSSGEQLLACGRIVWTGQGEVGLHWYGDDAPTFAAVRRLVQTARHEWEDAKIALHPASCRCLLRRAPELVLLG